MGSNGNCNKGSAAKEQPHDGRSNPQAGVNADGTMDVFGNMNDLGPAAVMFLMGVATWFLRERCIC